MTYQKATALGFVVLGAMVFMMRAAPGSGTGQAPDLTSLSDSELSSVSVHLERSACFGSCPAYSIVIHGDGRTEYLGKSNVKETGAHEGRVEPEKLRILLAEFAKAKFQEISEDYSEGNCKRRYCTDMPTVVTELTIRDKGHKVRHYYGCGNAPKALFELESAVDKAANSEQWTGDVSHSGPFGTTCMDRPS